MRRELAIIAGVVVPFVALVILGLVLLRDEAAPQPVTPPPASPPVSAPAPPAPPPPPRAEAVADAGAVEPALPRAIAAPVAAVTPEVLRCFDDQRAHLHEVQRLAVDFTPLPDGGFGGVRVPHLSNPWISACVEDVFEEVGFSPTGAETFQPATHTFVFDPARK